jgi:hypothetical protein
MPGPAEELAVVAYRGGVVVRAEQVTVAVRRILARPAGLLVYVSARRRPDPRSTTQRQADIRAGRGTAPIAPRRLLPPYDEGTSLRLGWLTGPDRAAWVYPAEESGDGAGIDATFALPLPGAAVDLVLAWPELGMPETVVPVPLPPAAELRAGSESIWKAPTGALPIPADLRGRDDEPAPHAGWLNQLAEVGRVIAGPRVLHRGGQAAVVLEHVTASRHGLELGVLSLARGRLGRAVTHAEYAWDRFLDRSFHTGARIGTVAGGQVRWLQQVTGEGSGGGRYEQRAAFVAPLTAGAAVDLLVSWPAAGLPDAMVRIPLPDPATAAAAAEPYWP